MSFKNTWFLPSAIRLKGYQRVLFRIAMILAPVLIAIGVAATLALFMHDFLAIAFSIILTLGIFPRILNTTKADKEQVKKYLEDEDFLENSLIIPKTDILPDLAYFHSTKEWFVLGHIDPKKFIEEIQTRDTLASSFDAEYLEKHVRHVYSSQEFSPKLKRSVLKVLHTKSPNTKPSTIVRIPPEKINEIKYAS